MLCLSLVRVALKGWIPQLSRVRLFGSRECYCSRIRASLSAYCGSCGPFDATDVFTEERLSPWGPSTRTLTPLA